ncbi:tetratricopeptide repeat protein [Oscillatoria sp. FACHB-1407]|uniref:tetratricopeptide repeat protein n=1 Tax=Oscillatoria sp. FACHB-1407 TaxID=2692847 RepID=UPI001684E692|nr:tetratricopeptide repeat protein [Oscillatoria sp. FACHB-1407]MBD2460522.1 tetratricopeptide repeat protein [Oscillatoria sp. FACHB-1407]
MDETSIKSLLENLKSSDETVRQQATHDLWQLWFQQKGAYGLALLGRSQTLLEAGAAHEAEELLTELIHDQPDFAEAWNRRAVLYYLQKQYRQSLADCEQVIALNPIHFGAIHGQGLCHMALGEYVAAIQAFRRALEIQPYSIENQRLMLECMAKLS